VTDTNARRLGRSLSHASWSLPILGLVIVSVSASFGEDPSISARILIVALMGLGGICGVVALIGILRWGDCDWSFAAFGLAISIFLLLMAFYGGD
jgi:hypothetical protein